MKKVILFFALLASLVVSAYGDTYKDYTLEQIEEIITNCNKIVVHTALEKTADMDYSDSEDKPMYTFTIVYDWPKERGCEIYIMDDSDTYTYSVFNVGAAEKLYYIDGEITDDWENADQVIYNFYDSQMEGNGLRFSIFQDKYIKQNHMAFFHKRELRALNTILIIDFYDRQGNIIAKNYTPMVEQNLLIANLFRMYLDKAYERYQNRKLVIPLHD